MPNITIPLATDPEVRASLQLLYADLPPWIRGWLVAEPGAPLPVPPCTPRGARAEFTALREELEETCALVNATHPARQWVVQRKGSHVGIGPAGAIGDGPVQHPAAEGRVVSLKAPLAARNRDQEGIAFSRTAAGVGVQTHGGHLFLDLTSEDEFWIFTRGELTVHGEYSKNGTRAHRQLYLKHGDATAPLFTEATRAMKAQGLVADDEMNYVAGDDAQILGADGAGALALSQDAVHPLQSTLDDPHITTEYERTLSRLVLLERWRAIPSAEDRARVATFWLGHPHSVLSSLGLMLTAQTPSTPLR